MPDEERKTFDADVVDRFQQLAQDCMLDHPELRNVAVSFCWKGGLNDTHGVRRGLWIGDDGPVLDLPGIFGALHQSMKMLDEQADRAFKLVNQLREEAVVLGEEVVKQKTELKKLEGDSGDKEKEDPETL